MVADKNGDGIVTREEMIVLDSDTEQKIRDRVSSSYADYLSLDPDRDDHLGLDEMLVIAKKAFDDVDQDKNDILSRKEISNVQ